MSRTQTSDREIQHYVLQCKQGHIWQATPLECNANAFDDWDGDGAKCPTCGEWVESVENIKMGDIC